MLLQALADHLRRLAGLEILVILDLLVLAFELFLVLLLQGLLLQAALGLARGQLVLERQNALLPLGQRLRLALHGLGHGELFLRLAALQPLAQALGLARALRERFVLVAQGLLIRLLLPQARKVQLALLPGEQLLLAAAQLLVEFAVAHLAGQLRIARLVHLKYLPAVGAAELLHGLSLPGFSVFSRFFAIMIPYSPQTGNHCLFLLAKRFEKGGFGGCFCAMSVV